MLMMHTRARWSIISIAFVSFFALCQSCYAQSISGVVLDYDTQQPVPFASIYFNKSYRGTIASEDGRFELSIGQFSGQDIIISCLGYKSEVISDYTPGRLHKIYLKRQNVLLEEVVVVAEGMPRKKMRDIFLKEFLGSTPYARKCKIENQEDLLLTYDKSSRTLTATSSKPLIINNEALGFRITYFLEEFKKDEKNMQYYGHSIFEDVSASAKAWERRKINRRREVAYRGSRMHFFRALSENKLKVSNFIVEDNKKATALNLQDHIRKVTGNTKCLTYPNTLRIYYSRNQVSYLSLGEDDQILFNSNGYFEATGNQWVGAMSKQRVGDLLPFEYQPDSRE